MRIVRLLFPKTLVYYLFFFLFCSAFMIMTLWGYYHLNAIESFFGVSIPFLDLHQRGNLMDWFFSLLWIHIAISSVVVLAGVLDHKEPKLHLFFWIALPILAVLLSGESICSFTSVIFNILVQSEKNDANPFFFSFIFLRFIYALFILFAFWVLFQFIRTRPMSRLLLFSATGICFLSFIFVFVFCSSFPRVPQNSAANIQQENPSDSKKSSKDPEINSPFKQEKKSPSNDSPKKNEKPLSPDPDNENPEDEPDSPEKTFHFAADLYQSDEMADNHSTDADSSGSLDYNGTSNTVDSSEDPGSSSSAKETSPSNSADSTSSKDHSNDTHYEIEKKDPVKIEHAILETPEKPRWEMIFGWRNTIEENLKLSRNIEEYFGWPESIETYLWRGKTPDIKRIRESIQYGGIGFFILMLSITIQFILRAGWLVSEKKLQEALTASRLNGITLGQ